VAAAEVVGRSREREQLADRIFASEPGGQLDGLLGRLDCLVGAAAAAQWLASLEQRAHALIEIGGRGRHSSGKACRVSSAETTARRLETGDPRVALAPRRAALGPANATHGCQQAKARPWKSARSSTPRPSR